MLLRSDISFLTNIGSLSKSGGQYMIESVDLINLCNMFIQESNVSHHCRKCFSCDSRLLVFDTTSIFASQGF